MNKIVEETSKQVGNFIDALKTTSPLSLALVLMNFLLMGFLFYSGAARKDTVQMIVAWQERTDQLMASCVSGDIMQMVLTALKRNGVNIRPEPEASPKQP